MFEIPVYQPALTGREKQYVLECLDSGWISSKGRFVRDFEAAFAEYVGVECAISVCNGTVALHLALVALGLGPGDEVIVPTLTYIASVNAIKYVGATPVFVDSTAEYWQIDPEDVRKKITPRTRAILAVHLYGHPCDMRKLVELAEENDLYVIEDCAEAIGSEYNNSHVGGFGHVSTFSFYGNKTITTGEGGMVVTNDRTLQERLLHFRGQGLAQHREYWHDVIGYNYRMTNICAAIGLAQLEQVDRFLVKKRTIAKRYEERFRNLPITFHQEAPGTKHSYWMCSILVEEPTHREELRRRLALANIETRPVFYPIHTMPMYSTRFQMHPVAEDLSRRGINLPSWPELNLAQVDRICDEIEQFCESFKR